MNTLKKQLREILNQNVSGIINKNVIDQILSLFESSQAEPMGVSAWKNCGIKYKYWDYLIKEVLAEQVEAIKGLSKTWKSCKRKNCDNKEECERANHYIETIWNPTFKKVLSILTKR